MYILHASLSPVQALLIVHVSSPVVSTVSHLLSSHVCENFPTSTVRFFLWCEGIDGRLRIPDVNITFSVLFFIVSNFEQFDDRYSYTVFEKREKKNEKIETIS